MSCLNGPDANKPDAVVVTALKRLLVFVLPICQFGRITRCKKMQFQSLPMLETVPIFVLLCMAILKNRHSCILWQGKELIYLPVGSSGFRMSSLPFQEKYSSEWHHAGTCHCKTHWTLIPGFVDSPGRSPSTEWREFPVSFGWPVAVSLTIPVRSWWTGWNSSHQETSKGNARLTSMLH